MPLLFAVPDPERQILGCHLCSAGPFTATELAQHIPTHNVSPSNVKARVDDICASLQGLRDEAISSLDNQIMRAGAFAKTALDYHAVGNHVKARAMLKKGLDAEYDAFGDCAVLGPIAEELYPDEDTSDWDPESTD